MLQNIELDGLPLCPERAAIGATRVVFPLRKCVRCVVTVRSSSAHDSNHNTTVNVHIHVHVYKINALLAGRILPSDKRLTILAM